MVWTKEKADMHKENVKEVQEQKGEAIVKGVLVADNIGGHVSWTLKSSELSGILN